MEETYFNATFVSGSTGSSGYIGTSGTSGSLGVSGSSGFSGAFGTSGYAGTSGWVGTPAKEKIITISNRDKLKKIKVKKEKVEPEWIEVNPSPVFEMALRIAKNSFYGILGIKVKGTKPSVVSGKMKKIK